jgi:D-xylose transport system permease protein
MTNIPLSSATSAAGKSVGPVKRFLNATEIDTRLLGMMAALLLIWIVFHVYGIIFNGMGAFLTPRNLWNVSVQMSSIGIMATGMVLVIVSRNIDLSVGAILGVTGMVMGILQVNILPGIVGLGNPIIWVVTALVGIAVGVLIGAFHGWLIAYRSIPSFIVTLGGLLVWRGFAFLSANGRTISPVDETFALLGGGPYGAVGAVGSWIVGIVACVGILWMIVSGRQSRQRHDFPLRPMWAEVFMGALGCGLVIGAVLLVNAYPWPKGIVDNYVAANGIILAEGETLFISHGFAYPVLIMVAVASVDDHSCDQDPVRPLCLCHRGQPGGCGAGRYPGEMGHPADLCADGRSGRSGCCGGVCPSEQCDQRAGAAR